MASFQTKVGKADVEKLMTVSYDLTKLINVVYNHVVKKTICDKLVNKVNFFDTKIPSTCGFVTKTQYNSKKQRVE